MDNNEVCCWIDKVNCVVSFHPEEGFEQKEFHSRKEMIEYCYILLSMGYKVQ